MIHAYVMRNGGIRADILVPDDFIEPGPYMIEHEPLVGHTMSVKLDRDTVMLQLVCHNPDGAWCRRACEEGCEEICSNPDDHIRPVGYCLPVEWMDGGGTTAEDFGGKSRTPLHDGMPVSLVWNGDYYEWDALSPSPLQEGTSQP